MLRKSNDIIEEAFKKKMLEGNIPPPPNAWGKLEANLGGPSTPPVNYWKWWAIAATILLFLGNGAIYYTLDNKIGDLEKVIEHQEHYVQHLGYFQNKVQEKHQKSKEIIDAQKTQIASLQQEVKDLRSSQNDLSNPQKNDLLNMLRQQYSQEIIAMRNQQKQLMQQNEKLLTENKDYKETFLTRTTSENKERPDTIFIVQKDSVLISHVIPQENNKKNKEKKYESKVKWGFYTGANLIYRNITANHIGETQVTGVRLDHKLKNRVGGTGGIHLMYPLNKKLDFVGGLGVDVLQEKYDLERTVTTQKTIENTSFTEQSYQFDIGTEQAKHYEENHNIWTYLDVNAGLNYCLIPDKWNLYFGMGIQRVLPLLSNNAEILATYNSSCTLAFEKVYGFGKNHNIGVSPYVKYYLSNAYNEQQALNVKPYMVGFQLNFQRK